jgi:CheY-like chemotaxis protein
MNEPCILQVEDDPNDVLLLRYAFERAAITAQLQTVTDGEEAIEYLGGVGRYRDRKQFPLPSLVLLDMELPKVSGMEVLQWVRTQPALRRLVIIMFSSSHLRHQISFAFDLGVNSFVVKPRDAKGRIEFARALKEWWLAMNEFPVVAETKPPVDNWRDDGARNVRAGARSKVRG